MPWIIHPRSFVSESTNLHDLSPHASSEHARDSKLSRGCNHLCTQYRSARFVILCTWWIHLYHIIAKDWNTQARRTNLHHFDLYTYRECTCDGTICHGPWMLESMVGDSMRETFIGGRKTPVTRTDSLRFDRSASLCTVWIWFCKS